MIKNHAVDIKKVFEAFESEVSLVEEHLSGMFKSEVFIIEVIGRHLLNSGGKRLRPLFLLASARLAGYKGKDHIALSGIVETIHTASLLHDDVVDGAETRRGKPAAHALWGNQAVILVGDFLYSNALKQTASFRNHDIIGALSAATTRMTKGEVLQLQKLADMGITEDEYMEIIYSKTGALISAACKVGAVLAGCTEQKQEALANYGLKAGAAFQMADDILDYMADEGDLGKRLGKDLDEGKVTLPVIYLLKAVGEEGREEVSNLLLNEINENSLKRMVELFRKHDVIEMSAGRARKLVDEAKAELDVFVQSPERDYLFELAEYALHRDK